MSSFIDSLFNRMQIPPHGDALVILRDRAMEEVAVTLACSGAQCTLIVSAPNAGVRTVAISAGEYEQLRKSIPIAELMGVGAIFVEALDGEYYLIKHVTSGRVTKSLLGNPRLSGSKELQSFAESLDSFFNQALKMAGRTRE